MINRALLVAMLLPLFVGALIVTAIVADRQTRTVAEVRYVTETQYVTVPKPQVVYVDRIVERVVEVPVETERQVVEVVVTSIPNVVPPGPEPVAPPPPEPPAVVTAPLPDPEPAAVCARQGKGGGKQVGICRKQGFP